MKWHGSSCTHASEGGPQRHGGYWSGGDHMTVNLVAVRSLIILAASASARARACVRCRRSKPFPQPCLATSDSAAQASTLPDRTSNQLSSRACFTCYGPGQTQARRGINRVTERRWQERVRERDRYLLFRRAKSAVDRTCFSDASGRQPASQPVCQSSLRPSPCQQVLGFEPGRPGSARLVPQLPWLPSRAPGPPAVSSSSSLPASRNSRCKQRPVIGPSLPVFRTRPLVQACQVGDVAWYIRPLRRHAQQRRTPATT